MAGVLLLAGPAGGAAAAELYLSAGAGIADATNSRFDDTAVNVDFDVGMPVGVVALGLAPVGRRHGWRFEVEGGYRYNDAEVVFFDDGRPDLAVDADSRLQATTLGANAVYEFDLGRGFRPFVGGGLGLAWVDYEINQYITEVRILEDDATALAYQLIAGLSMSLAPRWDLSLDYRFWQAPDIELEDVGGEPFDTDHSIHSAMLSLRYGFGGQASPVSLERPRRTAGWYLQAGYGPTRAKDAEIKNNIANFDAFDLGDTFTIGAGYTFAGPWRIELEAAHRQVEPELIDFNPEFGEDRANGQVRGRSLLGSVYYEPRWRLPFQPYAGIGAGVAWSDWDVSLNADGSAYLDDDATAAAFQVTLGACAALTGRLALTAEYRYWQTGLFDLEEPTGAPLRTELTMHSAMLGLRYRL